ncbi:hypothetical protein [Nocardia miyunensis]|uniref:hypothetical protein n=1 Tax=Nocardia miyunensis TaxID=282684 RepID=UPI000A98703A|nr:hypothetical protein [Nocardia miyunensis]
MSSAIYLRLLQEAIDHLEMDDVGIYEILWLARGSEFNLDDVTAKELTRTVVNQLLSDGTARLIILKWPTHEITVQEPQNVDLNLDSIFEPNSDNEYLGLTADDIHDIKSNTPGRDDGASARRIDPTQSSLDLP